MKHRSASASFLLFVLLLIPATLPAQQNTQLDSLLASCSQAMGSELAKGDLYAEGTIAYPGNEDSPAPFVWKAQHGDRVRQDVTFPAGVSTHIVNRGRGSKHQNGKRENLPAQTTSYFRSEYLPALSCLTDQMAKGIRSEYLGAETLNGVNIEHIRYIVRANGKNHQSEATEAMLSEYHVFIDSEHKVVATRNWVFSLDGIQNRSLLENRYSDYRNVNGILMPFRIEQFLDGVKRSEAAISAVRTDVALQDSDFQ